MEMSLTWCRMEGLMDGNSGAPPIWVCPSFSGRVAWMVVGQRRRRRRRFKITMHCSSFHLTFTVLLVRSTMINNSLRIVDTVYILSRDEANVS
jgi:hypothetical protein